MDTDGYDCSECSDSVYSCSCKDPGDQGKMKDYYSECLGSPAGAACDQFCDDLYLPGPAPASNSRYDEICDRSGASCGSYNPGAAVDLVSGTYEVNKDFIATIVSDPSPLHGCDDAIVNYDSGLFEVSDANSGELLYELGLRNGDRIVSINGLSLTSYSRAISAYLTLYINGETNYELSFVRDQQTETNNYELVE